jgi:hypothetical protein
MNEASIQRIVDILRAEDKEEVVEAIAYGLPDRDDIIKLPSSLQPGQVAKLCFFQMMQPLTVTVRTVHFTKSKVKYDLDVWLPDDTNTRIYNIDSVFITPA